MFFLAAEEKLLPKIIYDYSSQHKSTHLVNDYKKSVKNIYTYSIPYQSKETHLPIRYNPEEARTHR